MIFISTGLSFSLSCMRSLHSHGSCLKPKLSSCTRSLRKIWWGENWRMWALGRKLNGYKDFEGRGYRGGGRKGDWGGGEKIEGDGLERKRLVLVYHQQQWRGRGLNNPWMHCESQDFSACRIGAHNNARSWWILWISGLCMRVRLGMKALAYT